MKNRDELVIENIMRYLADAKISQAALARKAKVDPVNLNRIIKGKRGAGAEIAARISEAMGISLGQLYSDPSETQVSYNKKDPTRAEAIGRLNESLSRLSDAEVRTLMNLAEARALDKAKLKI